jgi:hypothetical protein
MAHSRAAPVGDRIVEPMIALAGCSKQHRIVVAGSKAVELMLELCIAAAMLARPPRQTAAIRPANTAWRWLTGGGARSELWRLRLIGWWSS